MLENLKSYSLTLKVKHLIGLCQRKRGRGANHEPSHNANSSVKCEASPSLLILACTEAFFFKSNMYHSIWSAFLYSSALTSNRTHWWYTIVYFKHSEFPFADCGPYSSENYSLPFYFVVKITRHNCFEILWESSN